MSRNFDRESGTFYERCIEAVQVAVVFMLFDFIRRDIFSEIILIMKMENKQAALFRAGFDT